MYASPSDVVEVWQEILLTHPQAFPDLAPSLPAVKMEIPPIARFLQVEDPGELKISEVGKLLKDYKRLAEELAIRGAFK